MKFATASPLTTSRPQESARASVVVGLLGSGIQRSRSPAMHEAEGLAQGLSFTYRLLDTDRMGNPAPSLADIVRFAEHLGFSGFNVTFPYKQAILPLVDELSDAARRVGSVNTVVLRDGLRYGHNTDIWGFRESFRRGLEGSARDTVLLIGAGGAGAAVAHALIDSGVGRLLVADKDAARADALVAGLSRHTGDGRAEAVHDMMEAARLADGIVNATPVGMDKVPGMPLPLVALRDTQWVADIVYFPLETEFLRNARLIGCRTLSGEGMAIFQAARAFELFTGIAPEVDRMRAAFAAFDGGPAAMPASDKTGRVPVV